MGWLLGGVVVIPFVGGLISYICGRIILPEMGLTAPGYWPWFWVSAVLTIAYTVIGIIKGALGND